MKHLTKVTAIAAGLLLVGLLTAQQTIGIAKATNERLTFSQKNSPAWNAGYSQGFFHTIPLKGTHTVDFFYGYMNGSYDLDFDRGYADGLSNLTGNATHTTTTHSLVRMDVYNEAYNAGQFDLKNWFSDKTWCRDCRGSLPKQTDDNYMNYYIGFGDGGAAASKRMETSPPFMGHWGEGFRGAGIECPIGHGTEYCTGYKAGWNSVAAQEA